MYVGNRLSVCKVLSKSFHALLPIECYTQTEVPIFWILQKFEQRAYFLLTWIDNRMEGGGRQSRLLNRLLGKLRNDKSAIVDKKMSGSSAGISESTGCGSCAYDDEDLETPQRIPTTISASSATMDDDQFSGNIDLRYGGQYLTPEQLPEFCSQLHNLVEVVRNIQSFAKVTGEYPSELERRLEREAREVAALAAEARNARDVIARTRAQRRAVRANKKLIAAHLVSLKETEMRELESNVRLSDRKLFKNWESLKDTSDPSAFEPLLEEIRNKQAALECLVRLVDSRRGRLARSPPLPPPLPPPPAITDTEVDSTTTTSISRKRHEGFRRISKRKRRDQRSAPLSEEPSRHEPQPQVSLVIQGTECSSRYRVGSAAAVTITPIDLNSRGSVRDILFFTSS